MSSLLDVTKMSDAELKGIVGAIYVVKCKNIKFEGLYSCGAVGLNKGNGNLLQRMKSHEHDWSRQFKADQSQLYRHEASPFQRFRAVSLEGWSKLGIKLGEHALFSRLSQVAVFKDHSCFVADDTTAIVALEAVLSDLASIEHIGNASPNAEKPLLP